MSTLQGRETAKLHLPGGTTSQLAFLSLGDGYNNTFVGLNAGNKFPSSNNTFVGAGSGSQAGRADTSVFIGARSGEQATRLGDVVALGYRAGEATRDSYSNVLIGSQAGSMLRRSDDNTAVGHKSMGSMVQGRRTVAIGAYSGMLASAAENDVMVGYSAGGRARGSENVFVGSNSGSNAQSFNAVAVGYEAGCLLESNAVTAIGSRALRSTVNASNTVAAGTDCASNAANILESVFVGKAACQEASNISQSVVIGANAGVSMSDCSNNVVVGYETGGELVSSVNNTLIGARSAGNVSSRFTTLVGSNSLVRRDKGRVNFGNCVVVGENISFDLPLDERSLTMDDIYRSYTVGQEFSDSSHLFKQPYQVIAPPSGVDNGFIAFRIVENAPSEQALTAEERQISIFSALQLTPGRYIVEWQCPIVDTQISDGVYVLYIDIQEIAPTQLSVDFELTIEGDTVVTRHVVIPTALDATTWLDTNITHDKNGIDVSYIFKSNSVTVVPDTEDSAVFVGALGTESSGGFIVEDISVSEVPPISVVRISADSVNNQKAVYAKITHKYRKNTEYVTAFYNTQSEHTVRGNASLVNVDDGNKLNIVKVATHPGFNAVDYEIIPGARYIRMQTSFSLSKTTVTVYETGDFGLDPPPKVVVPTPVTSTFGIDWLSDVKTTKDTVGDGYVFRCNVTEGSNLMTVFLASESNALLEITGTTAYSALNTVVESSHPLPIDLSGVLQSSDIWATVIVDHDIVTRKIQCFLRVASYSSGAAAAQDGPPVESIEYTITTDDTRELVDTSNTGTISLFADCDFTDVVSRDTTFDVTVDGGVPRFDGCVFIGSNFTIQNDTANTFIVSLGPQNIIKATPEICTISSNTHVSGSLTIGSSEEANYMTFRGLYGDGYEDDTPSAYIGERIYVPGSEKSELLLAKGEDPMGYNGPDRIRLVSGEVRLDVFSNISSNTYAYTRQSFEGIGNANTKSILIANSEGIFINGNIHYPELAGAAANYFLTIDGSTGILKPSDNTTLTAYLPGAIQTFATTAAAPNIVIVSDANGKFANSQVTTAAIESLMTLTANTLVKTDANSRLASTGVTIDTSNAISTSGNVTAGNISTGGKITTTGNVTAGNIIASFLYGNGSGLYGVTFSNITGTLSNSQLPSSINISGSVTAGTIGNSGTSFVGSSASVGTLSASSTITAPIIGSSTALLVGNGTSIANANASNITYGVLNNARLPSSISVGTMTATTIGNATNDITCRFVTATGNIVTGGNITSPIIGNTTNDIVCKNIDCNNIFMRSGPFDAGNNQISNLRTLGNNSTSIQPLGLELDAGSTTTGRIVRCTNNTKLFNIEHPTLPGMRLLHSCVEGARVDLMYRGTVQLKQGECIVDLNRDCVVDRPGMTPGTFQALCRNPAIFLQNNDTYDRVKGRVDMEKGVLHIQSSNKFCTANVDWMVVVERKDDAVMECPSTDENGYLRLEVLDSHYNRQL